MAEDRLVGLSRQIALVNYIERNPGLTVGELAQHFNRTNAQIRRDITLLDQAGFDDLLPGRTLEVDYDLYKSQGRVQLRDSLKLNASSLLTQEDLARLLFGLEALAPNLSEEERLLLPNVIGELANLAGPEDELALAKLDAAPLQADREKFHQLEQALQSGAWVSFGYVRGDGERSQRMVIPQSLVLERDGWLLVANSADSGQRSFRLDRMDSVALAEPQELAGHAPKAEDGAGHTDSSKDRGERVEVLLTPEAEWAVGESVASQVQPHPRGWQATYIVWDPEWFITELLLLAPYVVSTSPERYWVQAQKHARAALAVWDQHGNIHIDLNNPAASSIESEGPPNES